jgi:hypothetical protein
MANSINEKLMVSKRVLKKQAVKTIQDPVKASEPVRVKMSGPVKDKMVAKLTDFLAYLYSKYEDAEIVEHNKSEIKKIIKEEIQLVKNILDKKVK